MRLLGCLVMISLGCTKGGATSQSAKTSPPPSTGVTAPDGASAGAAEGEANAGGKEHSQIPYQSSTDAAAQDLAVEIGKRVFLATNVLIDTAYADTHALRSEDGPVLDKETKVRADQIQLSDTDDEKVGRLKSKNLKDALKDEIAPSLADALFGTWKVIEAYSTHPDGAIPVDILNTSEITFAAGGSYTVKNCFRLASEFHCEQGIWRPLMSDAIAGSACNGMEQPIWIDQTTYTLLDNAFIVFKYQQHSKFFANCGPGYEKIEDVITNMKSIARIETLTTDRIILSNLPTAILVLERIP